MRQSIVSICVVASAVLAASAAEAAAPAAYDWSGAYAGVFAGAAFGQSSVTSVVACDINGLLCFTDGTQAASAAYVGQVGSGHASGTGFAGGGFAGFNWQHGDVVYGLEADAGSLPLHFAVTGTAASQNAGLQNAGNVPSIFTISASAATDWMATARARFGFLPAPRLLLYGTAGIAATELTVANSYSDNFDNHVGTGSAESSSHSELRTALVIGAGAEWALAPRWTLRAEYLHTDFGALSTTGISTYLPQVPQSNPITATATLHADIVRLGAAYRF